MRFGSFAGLFKFIEAGQESFQTPGKGDAQAVGGDNDRVARAAFAIAGGPQFAEQKLAGPMPKENMVEAVGALGRVEFFPGAGVYLAANALVVKKPFGEAQAFGFQGE